MIGHSFNVITIVTKLSLMVMDGVLLSEWPVTCGDEPVVVQVNNVPEYGM